MIVNKIIPVCSVCIGAVHDTLEIIIIEALEQITNKLLPLR